MAWTLEGTGTFAIYGIRTLNWSKPWTKNQLALGDPSRQLRPRPHPEFAVDPAQVRLDRAHAQEQRVCDLPVRESAPHQVGDLLFGRRQVVRAGRPSSDPAHLGRGLVGPESRAEPLEDPQRPTE